MVVGIMGESCVGKSTLAEKLKQEIGAEIFTGKDYLRLAKNEGTAKEVFQKMLREAMSGENIIYVISRKEQIHFLPEGAFKVLVTAELETIQKRFAKRMNGILSPPVKLMLEREHGSFDSEEYDMHIIGEESNFSEACEQIKRKKGL